MLILYTSLIIPQSLNCDPLFSFIETFSGDWTVRKEYHHNHAPHTAEGSDNEKFEFPRRQTCFDVSDSGICQLIVIPNRLDYVYP